LFRVVEQRWIGHRDLRAEAAVAEVGPVTDLPVTYPYQIDEPVAGHVGEQD
jgi:hypothetical protein